MLAHNQNTTLRNSSDDHYLYSRLCENLKSYNSVSTLLLNFQRRGILESVTISCFHVKGLDP
jgi:hypothetical protein